MNLKKIEYNNKRRKNKKMNKQVFLNKKGYEINDTHMRSNIIKNIKNIGKFSITSKYYNFLSKKNLNEIRDGEFRISLSSYGKKYVLFLTSIEGQEYSILINKKNEIMVNCQYAFHESLYQGTLFDGELVKNFDDKWIFIINDVAYYKGKNCIVKSYDERQQLVEDILNNEYLKSQEHNNMTYVIKKQFFTNDYLQDLITRYKEGLNYKSSGIYFKNIYNYSDNYLYVFPECRTDHQVLHRNIDNENSNLNSNVSVNIEKPTISIQEEVKVELAQCLEEEEEDNIYGEVEVVQIKKENINKEEVVQKKIQQTSTNIIKKESIQRKNCKFLIRPTNKPDVFELYCRSVDKHIEKYSYAGIPNMVTSKLLKDIFKNYKQIDDITTLIKEKKAKYVECVYYKQFKKWVPIKECEEMDHHTLINEVTIMLDNLIEESDDDSDDSDEEDEPLAG